MVKPWSAQVLTILPDMFPGPLAHSLTGRALEDGFWSLTTHDIRNYGLGRHRSIDDTPAGGGPGMVMRPDVVGPALDNAIAEAPDITRIFLSPRGKPLTQSIVRKLANGPGVLLLCGRFEGVDERVIESKTLTEISIGDFVLSGGELAAMALIDAIVRLLPGVVGAEASLIEESFEQGRLEYPHYTRPREWEGRTIPDILLSGNHAKISKWRREEALRLTRERRPDLLAADERDDR